MSIFLTPVRIVLLGAFVAAVLAGLILVPAGADLPVHWGIDGQADLFLPRDAALMLPAAILAVIWGIFLGVERFASPEDIAAGRFITGVAVTTLTAMMLVIEIVLVLFGIGMPINVLQVVAAGIGIMLLVFGNAMPKSQPNSFAGIRMPSTLRDAGNWQATHRLGGVLALLGGVVLLGAAALAPAQQLIWWTIGCVLVPMLSATAYSLAYQHAHRHG